MGGSKQILWEYFFHRPTSRAFWQQRALGRRRRGQSFTIYPAMPCNALQYPAMPCVCFQYTLQCPEFHNIPCNALSQCPLIHSSAKGSQWVTQWVTKLDVHRPHTLHYIAHNGFDKRGGGEGSPGFGQMLCFKFSAVHPVHPCCYLFVRHSFSACLAFSLRC